jgi:hypothetical protein
MHHWVDRVTEGVGINVGDDRRADAGGAVLDGPNDIAQDAAGTPAPTVLLRPCLAFATLLGVDVAVVAWADGQAGALRPSSPPASGEGQTPLHRLLLGEENALPLTRPIFQGSLCEVARGAGCRVGSAPPRGRQEPKDPRFFGLLAKGLSDGEGMRDNVPAQGAPEGFPGYRRQP